VLLIRSVLKLSCCVKRRMFGFSQHLSLGLYRENERIICNKQVSVPTLSSTSHMPMSCHAEVSSYQSWIIANRKNVVAISVRHIRLSLAHLFEVLAALSIFAFLLRPRRLCTRHPFLFNCKHHFPLVQPHYNNQKSPCQHPENRIATRFSQKNRPLFPYSIFVYFE